MPAAPPLADPDAVERLGADLRSADYSPDGVLSRLGDSAHRALNRNERIPALRATAGGGELDTLIRLFLLGRTAPAEQVTAALPTLTAAGACRAGVLQDTGDGLRAALDVRPYADEDADYLVVSDLDNDVRPGPLRPDHVLGIGAASLTLARAVIRERVGRVLDLGTGCGIQALHCAGHADQVVATDTNPRALALAAATARLNGQRWDLRAGSLFEPVAGERFDLVVSNPPFVVGPAGRAYEYRDSGMGGDAICRALITGLPDVLADGGTAQLLANWIVRDGADWRERIGGWVAATGLDGWVVQRELADPAEYVALWLKDAGETGDAADAAAARWLDWFAAERVTGIGMGTVTLRRTGRDTPDVVLDEILGAGEEVSGPEAAAFLARRSWLLEQSDDRLLDAVVSLAPAAMLETRALPGADGWAPVLRMVHRVGGPGARVQLDEWGEALLAGCSGQVSLRILLQILAQAGGVDPGALAQALLPTVREALTRGVLHPVA